MPNEWDRAGPELIVFDRYEAQLYDHAYAAVLETGQIIIDKANALSNVSDPTAQHLFSGLVHFVRGEYLTLEPDPLNSLHIDILGPACEALTFEYSQQYNLHQVYSDGHYRLAAMYIEALLSSIDNIQQFGRRMPSVNDWKDIIKIIDDVDLPMYVYGSSEIYELKRDQRRLPEGVLIPVMHLRLFVEYLRSETQLHRWRESVYAYNLFRRAYKVR